MTIVWSLDGYGHDCAPAQHLRELWERPDDSTSTRRQLDHPGEIPRAGSTSDPGGPCGARPPERIGSRTVNSRRVVIALDAGDLALVKALVTQDRATSVSEFIRQAVAAALEHEVCLHDDIDEILTASGGPLTESEIRWTRSVLGFQTS